MRHISPRIVCEQIFVVWSVERGVTRILQRAVGRVIGRYGWQRWRRGSLRDCLARSVALRQRSPGWRGIAFAAALLLLAFGDLRKFAIDQDISFTLSSSQNSCHQCGVLRLQLRLQLRLRLLTHAELPTSPNGLCRVLVLKPVAL